MVDKEDRLLGSILNGRYLIEREIARGGVGVVYLARDKQLHSKPVVVKVLLEESNRDAWFQRKFRQEIEALARIDHPGVVGLLDAQEMPDGRIYIVMQYVQGVNLRSLIKPRGIDLARTANIMGQVCHALNSAHEKGVLHRDLKPENIMIQAPSTKEEYVKLIDFGIATVKDSQVSVDKLKTRVIGSFAYMAPEQFLGTPSAESDIYALGVIAYEMITGERPFKANTSVETYEMQRAGVKVQPRELRPDLTPKGQEVVLRALSFEAKARYDRAIDFGDELTEALTSRHAASQPSRPRRASSSGQRTAVLGSRRNNPGSPDPQQQPRLEIAHVLFMDVVGFSKLSMNKQAWVVRTLQHIVGETSAFRQARTASDLISLPTGDGMALAFFRYPVAPVQCALDVSQALTHHIQIKLRMGVHSGPVYINMDINGKENVTGGGINVAQRVMDCGDAGHILMSNVVADMLLQIGGWEDCLTDLGIATVKHGEQVHIFNLHKNSIGNPNLPEKLCQSIPDPVRRNSKAGQAEALSAQRPGDLNLGFLSPHLCNRTRQVNEFTDFFQSNMNGGIGKPQIYLVCGVETECHDSLVERLIHTQIKPFAEQKWGPQRGVVIPKKVSWAYDGPLMQSQQELIRMLFMEFDPAYSGQDLSAKALTLLAASRKSSLVIIQHRIYAKHWDKVTSELMKWYLTYWTEGSDRFSGPQFLIFLNIIYPKSEPARWARFWYSSKRFDKQSIEGELSKAINSESHSLPCLMLKELLPIRQEDVQDWLSRNSVHPEKTRYTLLEKIFRDEDGRINESKSMLDVEQELYQYVESLRYESIKMRGYL